MKFDIKNHNFVLLKILKDVYEEESIGPILGFKGGTAVYFFYKLPRCSIDLDFDLLDITKKEFVFEKIKEIINQYGIIKNLYIKRYNLFFLLSYKNASKNIKIEINLRDFDSSYEFKNYLGIPMLVMIKKDMTAHKLVAMYERMAARDIFDVWFFLKNNWQINEKIIKQRTGFDLNHFLKKLIDKLEKFPNKQILSGVGELINEKQEDWAKDKLKQETLFLLKLYL
ncbi:MAG: hypothetical protein GF335_00470 [Candidatus Moranbacteria bacterium]|nr:hypothetical protein [Candidatus Moranbacteria bacterium]